MINLSWFKVLCICIPCIWAIYASVPNFFYSKVEAFNDERKILSDRNENTSESKEHVHSWPFWLPSSIVNLGLDLRGGAHLLVEVQLEDVHRDRLETLWPQVRDKLRESAGKIGSIRRVESDPDTLLIRIGKASGLEEAFKKAGEVNKSIISMTQVNAKEYDILRDENMIVIKLSDAARDKIDSNTIAQAIQGRTEV